MIVIWRPQRKTYGPALFCSNTAFLGHLTLSPHCLLVAMGWESCGHRIQPLGLPLPVKVLFPEVSFMCGLMFHSKTRAHYVPFVLSC